MELTWSGDGDVVLVARHQLGYELEMVGKHCDLSPLGTKARPSGATLRLQQLHAQSAFVNPERVWFTRPDPARSSMIGLSGLSIDRNITAQYVMISPPSQVLTHP